MGEVRLESVRLGARGLRQCRGHSRLQGDRTWGEKEPYDKLGNKPTSVEQTSFFGRHDPGEPGPVTATGCASDRSPYSGRSQTAFCLDSL